MSIITKTVDKNTLSNILAMCLNNKRIKDFNLIVDTISKVSNYSHDIDVSLIELNHCIQFKLKDCHTDITIMFTNHNTMTICHDTPLPYVIREMINCDYNVQYDDILNHIFYDK